jgi:hypothetical protein
MRTELSSDSDISMLDSDAESEQLVMSVVLCECGSLGLRLLSSFVSKVFRWDKLIFNWASGCRFSSFPIFVSIDLHIE